LKQENLAANQPEIKIISQEEGGTLWRSAAPIGLTG